MTGHPLVPYTEDIALLATHTTAALPQAPSGTEVTVGGILTGLKRRKTKKGDMMATFLLEDLEGSIEVVVFPELYARTASTLAEDALMLVGGRAELDDRVRILATSIAPLQQARDQRTEGIAIRLVTTGMTDEILKQLMAALDAHKGSVPLYLEVDRPGGFLVTLRADGDRFCGAPGRDLQASVEAILGKGTVRYRTRQAPRSDN